MREFDAIGLKSCQLQANLFACSAEEAACSSPVFIRRFMNSGLACRIDAYGLFSESGTASDMLQEIEEEYGKSSYGKVKYGREELYWMGYLYRYWCYMFDESSAHVFKVIGARELHDLYFPYHSLDPEQAIRRIAESKGVVLEEDPIEKGVKALRKIRRGKGYTYYCIDLGD